ncbi:cellulose biosynthesis cyclic di-GMP-binding regulatory protein BcsB [Palleronia abyssalis]|uniref:Cellulose synthase subunit B-like C-terminal domain-containing protein n=1 Tax=Palleronia abyssalis TaxID=1501240 RepID=A0A2R8C0L0_9RHOB|nr:cellulose biosynthesis cyclic di-GMP-binding regulatory protein BcsB [Palleronia abyssalis]SPJ25961.1 hypothetical protein PAA8504_03817 [Palleronia abyssalis]
MNRSFTMCLRAACLCLVCVVGLAPEGRAQILPAPSRPAMSLPVPPGSAAILSEEGEIIALPSLAEREVEDARIVLLLGTPDTAGSDVIALPGQGPDRQAPQASGQPMHLAALWPRRAGMTAGTRVRLTGERDAVEFLLFVDDPRGVSEIVLTTQSSAYVFPERSRVSVTIGQTDLASFAPGNITEAGRIAFEVPPGALRPGPNLLRVSVDHAHRIFCGAEAAYDLWTEIDLSQSGAQLAGRSIGSGAAGFFTAAGIARGTGDPIHVLGGADRAQVLDVLARLGHVMNGDGLSFSFEAPEGTDAAAPLIRVEPGAQSQVRFSRDHQGRSEMRVVIGPAGLPDLRGDLGPGIVLEDPLPELARNRKVSLRELGYGDHEVAQNLWSGRFGFALPADWLITTDARAEIGLRMGTAYMLPAGAEARVLVNGSAIRMLPLSDRLYESGKALRIRFPSRLLRGGRNELRIDLVVPGDPADRPCPVVSSPKMFLDAETTLFVPASPQMVGPDIGRALDRLTVAGLLDPGDAGAIGSAGIARLAATLPLEGEAGPGPGVNLRVLGIDEVPQASFGSLWSGREVLLNTLQIETDPVVVTPAVVPGLPAPPPVETLRMSVLPEGNPVHWLAGTAGDMARGARDLLRPDMASDLAAWMAPRRGQAMLYQLDKESPDQLYLVLASGADVQTVFSALGRAMVSDVPLGGQVALLDWEGNWASWADRTRLPVLTGKMSWGNLRAVIGNYASARPLYFALALMALTLVSAMIARGVILQSRPRS